MHCPYYSETIKSAALLCKRCGSDLREYHRTVKEDKAKRPFYMKWWVWVTGVFLILYSIINIFPLLSNSNKPVPPSDKHVARGDRFTKMAPAEHREIAGPSRGLGLASVHLSAQSETSQRTSKAGEREKSEKDLNDAMKDLARNMMNQNKLHGIMTNPHRRKIQQTI